MPAHRFRVLAQSLCLLLLARAAASAASALAAGSRRTSLVSHSFTAAARCHRALACMADDVSGAPAVLDAVAPTTADSAYDRALAAASPSGLSMRLWDQLWAALAGDPGFIAAFGSTAWKYDGAVNFARGAFTMRDLHARAHEYPSVFGAAAVKYNEQYLMRSFNPAVKASGRPGAWSLDLPDGDDARIDPTAVTDALQASTVVLNSAGFFIAPLSAIALSMLGAFQLPVWLNMYLTRPGLTLSTQLHTDLQDVFVVQTQGRKRWRVYAPPDPSLSIGANPLARGKGRDTLPESALAAPLIDTVMRPGELLYVPAGFPHTTSTELDGAPDAQSGHESGLSGAEPGAEGPSVHLTLGVDTHLWGLSFMRMREVALLRRGQSALIEGRQLPTALAREPYFLLQHPLPLGMLAARALAPDAAAGAAAEDGRARQSAERARLAAAMAVDCAARMLIVEPQRWAAHAGSPEGLARELGLEEVAHRMIAHYDQVMAAVCRLCQGGAAATGEPPLVRAQPWMGALDDAQQALADWAERREHAAAGAAGAAGVAAGRAAEPAMAAAGAGSPKAKGGKGGGKAKASKGFGSR